MLNKVILLNKLKNMACPPYIKLHDPLYDCIEKGSTPSVGAFPSLTCSGRFLTLYLPGVPADPL